MCPELECSAAFVVPGNAIKSAGVTARCFGESLGHACLLIYAKRDLHRQSGQRGILLQMREALCWTRD